MAGKFAAETNSTDCFPCQRGEFQESSNGKECFLCPRGWSTNDVASPTCIQCEKRWRSSIRPNPGQGSELCVPCLLGEVQPPDSGQCFYCAKGKYTMEAGEQLYIETFDEDEPTHANCHDCPIGAACRGGAFLRSKNGYWRSSNKSITFTKCFHPYACEGASRTEIKDKHLTIDRNESCAVGYDGILCHGCGPGWGRCVNSSFFCNDVYIIF